MEAAIEGVGFYDMEGVRFYPTDEELIRLLEAKRLDPGFSVQMILQTNIYQSEPQQLCDEWRRVTGKNEKWCNYYSAPDYMKESSQHLQQLTENGYCNDFVKRSTKTGYWKVTGKPRFIRDKRSKDKIGFKRTLVFYMRSPRSKETRTNWVMREFVIRYDPSFKKDFVLCRIKCKQDKKRRISTKNEDRRAKKARASINDEAQPSHNMAFDHGIHDYYSRIRNPVGENNSAESISNSSNSPELQPLPSCDSIPNSGQHTAEASEYTSQVDALPLAEASVLNGCVGLDQTSVLALQSPMLPESRPQPSSDSISNSGQHAVETPEYTSEVDPLPLLNGCSGLDQISVFALQSSMLPESQPQPSSDSISNSGQHATTGTPECTSAVDPLPPLNDCSGLDRTSFSALLLSIQNSPLGIEWEFNSSPPFTDQVECPREETGHGTPLYLNSSNSAGEFCGGDINDVDTETFLSSVSNFFNLNTSDACVNPHYIL